LKDRYEYIKKGIGEIIELFGNNWEYFEDGNS
jgi:hypothetical protein